MFSDFFHFCFGRFAKFSLNAISVLILRLFFRSRPTRVPRLVMPVIVRIAVNAMACRRSWPHVCQKVFKGIEPTLTDSNTPAAVVFISDILRIIASLFNGLPRRVLAANLSDAAMSMCRQIIPAQAATRAYGAFSQAARSNEGNFAAVTLANPSALSTTSAFAKNNKSGKPFPNEVVSVTRSFHRPDTYLNLFQLSKERWSVL